MAAPRSSFSNMSQELLREIAKHLATESDQHLVDVKSFSLVSHKCREAAAPELFKTALFALRPDVLPPFSPSHLTGRMKKHVRTLVFETSFYDIELAKDWTAYDNALRLWLCTEHDIDHSPDDDEGLKMSRDGHKIYSHFARFQQMSSSIGLGQSLHRGLRDMTGLRTVIFAKNTSIETIRFQKLLIDLGVPVSTKVLPRSGSEIIQLWGAFDADDKQIVAGHFYAFLREAAGLIHERAQTGKRALALRRLETQYALCHPVFDIPESLEQDALQVFALLEQVSLTVAVGTLRHSGDATPIPATKTLSTMIIPRLLAQSENLRTLSIGTDYNFQKRETTAPWGLNTELDDIWATDIPRGEEAVDTTKPGLGLFLGTKRWSHLSTAQLHGIAAHETEILAFILTHAPTLKTLKCKQVRLLTGTWSSVVETLHHEHESIRGIKQLDLEVVGDKHCEFKLCPNGVEYWVSLPYSYLNWDGSTHRRTKFVDRDEVEFWKSRHIQWQQTSPVVPLDEFFGADFEDFDPNSWT